MGAAVVLQVRAAQCACVRSRAAVCGEAPRETEGEMTPSHDATPVYLEVGTKRVFACALAWPGWCRSGKTEDAALTTLASYAGRYAIVAREAGIAFPETQQPAFHVEERLAGSAGYTDF